jgi:hypothetical protein
MTLYQEMPKSSIMSELRKRFTAQELEPVKVEVMNLLHECTTMDQFTDRVSEIIKRRQSAAEFTKIHHGNFNGA